MSPHLKIAGLILLSATTAASASTIPLKAGDYGDATLGCDNEPNAGIVSFDGRNFSYPHATKCIDTMAGRASGVLRVTETCRANGDGSRSAPSTEAFKIKIIGADRFTKTTGKLSATYRRCGALGFFDKH